MVNDDIIDSGGADTEDIETQTAAPSNSLFGEYSNDPSIQKFNDPKDLAKSYIELQKMVGKNRIEIPSTPEGLSDVFSKLGKPESPDKYSDFDDALNVFGSAEDFKAFKEIAHEADLLPQQYDKIYNKMKEITAKTNEMTMQARQEIINQSVAKLQSEFGDEYNQKIKLVDRLMRSLPEDVQSALMQSNLDIHPEFIKIMAELAENYKEDSFVVSDYSPAEAKDELEAIKSNKEHPYWNKMHPEHEAAIDKVDKLYKLIYG